MNPAYLAGPNYDLQPFERLTSECAWSLSDSWALGSYLAWSPDHRFWFGETTGSGTWWRIAAVREPLGPTAWMTRLSWRTPPEVVIALANEVALPGPSTTARSDEEHPALRAPSDRRSLLRILTDAGWRSVYRAGTLDVEAPDRLARVRVRVDPPGDLLDLADDPHIRVEVGPRGSGGQPPYWQSMVTAGAPTVITDALARALTTSNPVTRDKRSMDERLLADLARISPPKALQQPVRRAAPRPAATTIAQRVAAAGSRTTMPTRSTATAGGTGPAAGAPSPSTGRPAR
ncbi:hypothetical protein [Kitasatospora griseola]|uniref:hypothetical protein n=1 Tax=Kitasatospora griseola TaxID=2064 RepID=UPI003429D741